MAFLGRTIRKVFFWNYARNTWQWDILCVLILIFIFLTPKTWFESSERASIRAHQSPTSILLVSAEVVENAQDKSQLQQRVRALTGRSDVEVTQVRKLTDEKGKTRGYEVDIR
jgi:hypothetical protein